MNGTLFFFAANNPNGNLPDYKYKLWKSDGTAAGTVLIKVAVGDSVTIRPSIYQPIWVMNGVYYFNRSELWRSDGTAAGTYRVKDINPSGGADPESLVVANGKLFFRANDGVNGSALWKSDGTAAGTVMVKDLQPGNMHTGPTNLFSDGTRVFFGAVDSHLYELWRSDGTTAGTFIPKDINPNGYSDPGHSATFTGKLYFSANDGQHGYELWKSDGTAAGTVLVKNINVPVDGDGEVLGSSHPDGFREKDGKLYFSATQLFYGNELWVTDGTANGTVMFKDIKPNGNSRPTELSVVGNKLVFFADDGAHGRELFSYGLCGNFNPFREVAEESTEPSELQLNVLENPVRQTITAEVRGTDGQAVSLYLTDLQGKTLQKRTITTSETTERQSFDVTHQANGTLLLRVVSGNGSRTVRILKID